MRNSEINQQDTASSRIESTKLSAKQKSVNTTTTPASPIYKYLGNNNTFASPSPPLPTLSEREQLKAEFYKTYDVMTGVRIAATLGGFFSLMVFFVVYKSRCGRGKSISSNDIAAAAAELDAISELPFDGFYSLTAPRRSLGNMSAPAAVRTRFSTSSYVSMNDYELKSLPGSVVGGYNPGWSDVINDNRSSQPVQRADTYSRGSSFLVVPGVRLSSTGSSSDSSYYLEHHGSVELSLPPAPRPRRCWRRSTIAHEAPNLSNEDFPIDINVIQPTPDISPCGSERQLYRQRASSSQWSTCGGRLAAPLASIGSASLTDYPESDIRSIGSDSVFYNDGFTSESSEEAATCESSDTESESSDEVCMTTGHRIKRPLENKTVPQVEFSQFLQVPSMSIPTRSVSPVGRWGSSNAYQPKRRMSSPIPHIFRGGTCETISEQVAANKLGVSEEEENNSSVTSLTVPVCMPLRQTGGSEQQNTCSQENVNDTDSNVIRTTETFF